MIFPELRSACASKASRIALCFSIAWRPDVEIVMPYRSPKTNKSGTKRMKLMCVDVFSQRILGVFGGLVVFGATVSAPASAETLQQAFESAYLGNPTLLAQQASLRATDEGVAQAISGYRPSVLVQGSVGANRNSFDPVVNQDAIDAGIEACEQLPEEQQQECLDQLSGNSPVFKSEPKSVGAVFTQPIFNGMSTYYGVKRADSQVDASRESLRTVEQRVFLDTVTAYTDVVRDQAVVELNRNQVQVLMRQLEATQDRFRVGEITRTDVAQSEARLAGAVSALTQGEAQLTRSRAFYLRTVGHLPDGVQPLAVLPVTPANEDDAINIGLQENPALLQARRTEEASHYFIDETTGGLLPSLRLEGRASKAWDPNTSTISSDSLSVSLQGQIPLYQSGATWSRVRQARQTNSADRLRIAEAYRTVVENVTNSWEQLRSAKGQIQSGMAQVSANEIALEGVRQESFVGTRTTLDVLDAEQELNDSQVSLVRAQRDQYVAAYALLASIGRLNAQNLGLSAAFYDPSDNYQDVRGKWFGYDLSPSSYVGDPDSN